MRMSEGPMFRAGTAWVKNLSGFDTNGLALPQGIMPEAKLLYKEVGYESGICGPAG